MGQMWKNKNVKTLLRLFLRYSHFLSTFLWTAPFRSFIKIEQNMYKMDKISFTPLQQNVSFPEPCFVILIFAKRHNVETSCAEFCPNC